MQIPVRLGRESSEHLATRRGEVSLPELGLDLRVLSWFV
jgi:hypothetical protein